jgi:hypothetical protein
VGGGGVMNMKTKHYMQTRLFFLRVSFVQLHVWKLEPILLDVHGKQLLAIHCRSGFLFHPLK